MFERPRGGERAVLVGVGIGHPVDPHDTAEFAALAASAGTLAVGTVLAARARPDPKYFVGSGKADEIRCKSTSFAPRLSNASRLMCGECSSDIVPTAYSMISLICFQCSANPSALLAPTD